MTNQHNIALCDREQNVHLRVLDCGVAHATTEEWSAAVILPSFARLYYILGGNPYIIWNGKQQPLMPGNCYLLPTGSSFQYSCLTEMDQIYFHINLLDRNGCDLLRSCSDPLCFTPELATLKTLQKEMYQSDIPNLLMLQSHLLLDLGQLFEMNGFWPTPITLSACVQGAVSQIGKAPSIQLNSAALAKGLFVSPSTLSKKFRAEIGRTIGAYIDEMVFFEAEQLLHTSNLSISEISNRLGFCDQFYFSRRFKERYGVCPKKYRYYNIV